MTLPNLRDAFEYAEIFGGLPLLSADPDKPAYQAGMRAGDVLLSIDGTELGDYSHYAEAIEAAIQSGRGYADLVVWRPSIGQEFTTRMTVPVRAEPDDQEPPCQSSQSN